MITSSYITSFLEKLEDIDYHVVIKELLSLYTTIDFRKAVEDVARKYYMSSLDLVLLYMKVTGTLESELPDNYSLKDFKGSGKKPQSSGPGQSGGGKGKIPGNFY